MAVKTNHPWLGMPEFILYHFSTEEGHCHITRVIYLHEVFIHLRGMNGITESYGNTTSGYLLYTTFGADRLNLHCL